MLAILIGISAYAQKDQFKAVEKALKGGDVATAKTNIDQAEGLVANADQKTKAKFYFLKAKTYFDIAKKNPALDEKAYDKAAQSFQDLISFEKQSGKAKYTEEAQPLLDALTDEISKKGIEEYQSKKYAQAKSTLLKRYNLRELDTMYLEYAAMAAYLDKDYDVALTSFKKLKDLGYSGITTTYSAANNESGQRENFASKSQMDIMIKTGQYKDAKVETSKSKKGDVIKNIAFILVEKGEVENAIAAVQEARKIAPKDINIILTEANLLLKLGKKEEFAALMKEAIQQDPTNPSLYFNVGVISQEQGNTEEAKSYYNKAIEIDADYSDAYLNLGALTLQKDKEYVEAMNDNLSNFKKYDAIKEQQKELYKEVLPFYEKAFEIKKRKNAKEDVEIARTLMSLYENLEMDDKFKSMKAIWDASRE